MTDRRSARAARLLDPVWHQLQTALQQLYAEIEPGSQAAGISTTILNTDGTLVTYTITLSAPGTILRHVLTDPQALIDALESSTIDAT